MDWKKLLLNAALAAGWVLLAELELVPAVWAGPAAFALRAGLGWLAAKLGKPVPVDS